jgi:mono/diheme cytochrome c family protein
MSNENPGLISPTPPDPHEAIQPQSPDFRETPDIPPFADLREHFPAWLYIVCGVALFLAGSSFTGFETFGRGMIDQGAGGAMQQQGGEVAEAPLTPAQQGGKVYGQNCASCHQASGAGQPGAYPPLVGSEYVLGSKQRLAAILLKGLQGPLTVNGGSYGTQVMPGWETSIAPDKMADLMTYLRSQWGNTGSAVTEDDINAAKTKYGSHSSAFTEQELKAMPATDPK